MGDAVEAAKAKVQAILDEGYAIDGQIAELRERKRGLGLAEAIAEQDAAEAEAAAAQRAADAEARAVDVGTAEEVVSGG